MKEVRNSQLRKMLNKEGIKDVVLNFSEGVCRVYSDDKETNDVFTNGWYESEYCMHFCHQSIQSWAEWIREVWHECKIEQEERRQPSEFKTRIIKISKL